jgi:hypothetical protein
MPQKKRLSGVKNYLYLGVPGTVIEGASTPVPLPEEQFYKITSIGASTGFPAGAVVGDLIYNKPSLSLEEGDAAIPLPMHVLAFVTNVPNQAQKEKYEDTTQVDDSKSYQEGDKPEISGNVDGYFIANDEDVDLILGRFFRIVEDDGAGVRTYKPTITGVLHFFLGRDETTDVGENELMQYLPSILDSLDTQKPMEGPQTLNFNYTAVGSERPTLYRRTITA